MRGFHRAPVTQDGVCIGREQQPGTDIVRRFCLQVCDRTNKFLTVVFPGRLRAIDHLGFPPLGLAFALGAIHESAGGILERLAAGIISCEGGTNRQRAACAALKLRFGHANAVVTSVGGSIGIELDGEHAAIVESAVRHAAVFRALGQIDIATGRFVIVGFDARTDKYLTSVLGGIDLHVSVAALVVTVEIARRGVLLAYWIMADTISVVASVFGKDVRNQLLVVDAEIPVVGDKIDIAFALPCGIANGADGDVLIAVAAVTGIVAVVAIAVAIVVVTAADTFEIALERGFFAGARDSFAREDQLIGVFDFGGEGKLFIIFGTDRKFVSIDFVLEAVPDIVQVTAAVFQHGDGQGEIDAFIVDQNLLGAPGADQTVLGQAAQLFAGDKRQQQECCHE